jgi:organic radical activating enzyme
MSIYLVESFYSIQGEGKLSGTPSVFLRFGGCNLTCKGFGVEYKINNQKLHGCDSFYAVDVNFKSQWQEINHLSELISVIKKYKKTKYVVITGGEPLIYANNNIFLEFLDFLNSRNFTITIETNATQKIKKENFKFYKNSIFAMSVKLSNADEKSTKRVNLDVIRDLININQNSFFKFSIEPKNIKNLALNEILEVKNYFLNTEIICMPVASTREELKNNANSVINFCLENSFTYSDRLHIRMWNNKKGV